MLRLAYPYGTPETEHPVLGFQGPAERALGELAELGYSGVELFVRDPARLNLAELAGDVARAGLIVVQLGTGPVVKDDGFTFTDPDPACRREAVARGCSIARMAAELETHVNVGSLRGDVDARNPAASWQWMQQGVEAVCAEADRHGTRVVLEPQNRSVVNNLNGMQEAVAFVDDLGLPNLFVMLDVFHVLTEGQSLARALQLGGDRIIHLHVADRARAVPGQGDFDLPDVMRQLRAFGHPGHVTVEIRQEPNPRAAAQAARQYLLTLWEEMAS